MAAYRYEISLFVLKKTFQNWKRNFVAPRGHVISSIHTDFQIYRHFHI